MLGAGPGCLRSPQLGLVSGWLQVADEPKPALWRRRVEPAPYSGGLQVEPAPYFFTVSSTFAVPLETVTDCVVTLPSSLQVFKV
jgi:hypothetical protein